MVFNAYLIAFGGLAGRFIQGVGGGGGDPRNDRHHVSPIQANARERSGIYAFVAAAGASLGLLLGGPMTQLIDWHWIFFVNLPIGVLPSPTPSACCPENPAWDFARALISPGRPCSFPA